MTVNTVNITSGPYTGNGVTDTFSYTFRIENKTQIKVFQTTDLGAETELTVDTDYTVAGIGVDGGGTITRVAGALPTDYIWYIRSDYKETQLTAFSSQGGFFPEVHEAVMDKLTFLVQQLRDSVDRSFKLPDRFNETFSTEITPESGAVLGWVGNVLSNVVLTFQSNGNADIFDSIASAVAATNAVGSTVYTNSYYSGWAATLGGPEGGGEYQVVTKAEHDIIRGYGTVDEFADHTDAGGNVLLLVVDIAVSEVQLGAIGDNSTDSNLQLQATIDFAESMGLPIKWSAGFYVTSAPLNVGIGNTLAAWQGAGKTNRPMTVISPTTNFAHFSVIRNWDDSMYVNGGESRDGPPADISISAGGDQTNNFSRYVNIDSVRININGAQTNRITAFDLMSQHETSLLENVVAGGNAVAKGYPLRLTSQSADEGSNNGYKHKNHITYGIGWISEFKIIGSSDIDIDGWVTSTPGHTGPVFHANTQNMKMRNIHSEGGLAGQPIILNEGKDIRVDQSWFLIPALGIGDSIFKSTGAGGNALGGIMLTDTVVAPLGGSWANVPNAATLVLYDDTQQTALDGDISYPLEMLYRAGWFVSKIGQMNRSGYQVWDDNGFPESLQRGHTIIGEEFIQKSVVFSSNNSTPSVKNLCVLDLSGYTTNNDITEFVDSTEEQRVMIVNSNPARTQRIIHDITKFACIGAVDQLLEPYSTLEFYRPVGETFFQQISPNVRPQNGTGNASAFSNRTSNLNTYGKWAGKQAYHTVDQIWYYTTGTTDVSPWLRVSDDVSVYTPV